MKIQVCDHQHNVLRFGSSCSSSINEQEKDEEKEVIPKAAAVSPNKIDKNHSRTHSKIGFSCWDITVENNGLTTEKCS